MEGPDAGARSPRAVVRRVERAEPLSVRAQCWALAMRLPGRVSSALGVVFCPRGLMRPEGKAHAGRKDQGPFSGEIPPVVSGEDRNGGGPHERTARSRQGPWVPTPFQGARAAPVAPCPTRVMACAELPPLLDPPRRRGPGFSGPPLPPGGRARCSVRLGSGEGAVGQSRSRN